MDYFQGVVADYLNADPSMFVKPECCIQLNPGELIKGEHWYCDILAVSLREPEPAAYLCEVTLSKSLAALITRLAEWDAHWPEVRAALARDNSIPAEWPVRPWAFVPAAQRALVSQKVSSLFAQEPLPQRMPRPLVTRLEDVVPWLYSSPHELPGRNESSA